MGGLFELSGFGLNSLFLTVGVLLLQGRVASSRLRAGLWALPFLVPVVYLALEAVPALSGLLGFRLSHLFWHRVAPLLPIFAALDGLGALYALWRLRVREESVPLPGDHSLGREWRVALGRSGLPPVPIRSSVGGPVARMTGLLRPRLVVVPGVLMTLAPEERMAVLLHEAGHLKHRDLPLLYLLRFWRESHPWLPWLRLALGRFMMAREEMADDHAVGVLGSPLPLARAVLLLLGGPASETALSGGDALRRVERLLGTDAAGQNTGHWACLLLLIGLIT